MRSPPAAWCQHLPSSTVKAGWHQPQVLLILIPSVSGTGFPYEKVVQRVLYLQVLDYDRFSRNDPIGEVSIPLNKVDLTQMQTFWKDLKPCSDGSVRPWSPSHPLGTVLKGRQALVPVVFRRDHHPLATPTGTFAALREGWTSSGQVASPKYLSINYATK